DICLAPACTFEAASKGYCMKHCEDFAYRSYENIRAGD
ncbi:hypothetical protein LCGC14_2158830, partial [marine sediment metagenome]